MTKSNRHDDEDQQWANRRALVLMLTIGLLSGSLLAWAFGREGTGRFAAAAMGRMGLVFGALWLAWPSLRRPAKWLPPSVAVMGVVVLAVLAAQPRLVVVAVPALAVLMTLAAVIRAAK